MKRSQLFVLMAPALGLILLTRITFSAEPQTQDVRGLYSGFSQSAERSGSEPVAAQVDFLSQARRQLQGEAFCVDWMPDPFRVNATIAASGNLNVRGQQGDCHIILEWSWGEYESGAAIVDGRSKVVGCGNNLRFSDILLRDANFDPQNPSPDASGRYEGVAVSGASGETQTWDMDLQRRADSRTGFAGNLTINGEDVGFLAGAILATLDGSGNTVMIGVDSGSKLKIRGHFDALADPDSPVIEGEYEIISVGDRSLGGPDTVVDFGHYELYRVPPVPQFAELLPAVQ